MKDNNFVYSTIKFIYTHLGEKGRSYLGNNSTINKIYLYMSKYAFDKDNETPLGTIGGQEMYVTSDFMGYCLLGEYEPETTDKIINLLNEGDLFVDIGANIGYFTLIAAKKVGKSGKVFAFEPDPDNYQLLTKNIEHNNFKNVLTIQKAVSNQTGTSEFFFRGSSTHSLFSTAYNNRSNDSMKVDTVTIDDFFNEKDLIKSIRLIKMDIEGAEILALLGMSNLLKENENLSIIMEFNPEFLKSAGFDPQDLLTNIYDHGFKIDVLGNDLKPEVVLKDILPGSGVNLYCYK